MLYGAKTTTSTPSIPEVVNVIVFAPYNMRLHDNPLTTLKNCHPYYLYDENSANNYLDDSIHDLNYKLNSQGGQLNIIKGSTTDDIISKFLEQLRNIENVHVNLMLSPIQPNKNLIDKLNRALTKEKIPYSIFNDSLLQETVDLPSFNNVFNPKIKQVYDSVGKYYIYIYIYIYCNRLLIKI
jgi:deoxyribodipyrimidine photolyase